MYNTTKENWLNANRGVSLAESRERMNVILCEEISQARSLAMSRTPAAALARTRDERRRRARERVRKNPKRPGRFFAKKDAPDGWSLNAHIESMNLRDSYFTFRHTRRSGGRPLEEYLYKADVNSLKPKQWFTDAVVNSYMALLSGPGNAGSTNSIFLTSLFFSKFTLTESTRMGPPDPHYVGSPPSTRHRLVQRWTRNLNTTGKNVKIFVPVNFGQNHWMMMMIDSERKKVVSMDSLRIDHAIEREELLGWLEAEYASKNKPFQRSQWKSETKVVPRQRNGWDCGPFTCMFAAFMSNDKRMSFLQGDLPKMRRRIAWSILHMQL